MTIERKFVNEKIQELEIKRLLEDELESAGFSDAELKRTPMGTHIIIRALRPGLVIGTGGENVKKLTKKLKARNLENPHIEVQKIENPNLNAKIVAWRIGKLLERGYYFKSVAMRTIEHVMRAGARGVEININGKTPSARARNWSFRRGYVRHCGQTAKEDILYGKYISELKQGLVGVKVTIMPPQISFPDEVKLPEAEIPKIQEPSITRIEKETEEDEEIEIEEPKKKSKSKKKKKKTKKKGKKKKKSESKKESKKDEKKDKKSKKKSKKKSSQAGESEKESKAEKSKSKKKRKKEKTKKSNKKGKKSKKSKSKSKKSDKKSEKNGGEEE